MNLHPKLHTTQPLSVVRELHELTDSEHQRAFVWVNATPMMMAQIKRFLRLNNHSDIVTDIGELMPAWFFLMVNEFKTFGQCGNQQALVESILRGAYFNARLRGDYFGYSLEDVQWYQGEIERAANRAANYFNVNAREFLR